MRKKRRLRTRTRTPERLFTQENLDIAVRLASFVGHALKATPYAKHAIPILDITNAARDAFVVKRNPEREQASAQQNLRLQVTSLTSRLANLDPQLNAVEYAQISSQLDTLLTNLTATTSN